MVRSPEKHDLLFQTADLTWHAYNGYGGLTTYGSFHYPYLRVSVRKANLRRFKTCRVDGVLVG